MPDFTNNDSFNAECPNVECKAPSEGAPKMEGVVGQCPACGLDVKIVREVDEEGTETWKLVPYETFRSVLNQFLAECGDEEVVKLHDFGPRGPVDQETVTKLGDDDKN